MPAVPRGGQLLDQHDVSQRGQAIQDRSDLAFEQTRAHHQHRWFGDGHSRRYGSGPNAANNGHNTAPCFQVPRAATYKAGTLPSSVNTRSPRRTPSASSAFAKRLLRSSNSE